MKLLYVLPKKNYFSRGMRGSVSHAIGLGESFSKNGVDTEIVSGVGADQYFKHSSVNEVSGRGPWILALLKEIKNICTPMQTQKKIVLIRYTSSNSWLISLCINIFRKDGATIFGFEINSLAYHQVKRAPQFIRRLLLKVECQILSRADFCYVVSEQIKNDITSSSNCEVLASKVVVVPNGGPEAIPLEIPKYDSEDNTYFVFFGIYQEYYNIEVVIEAFKQLTNDYDNIKLYFYGAGPQLPTIQKATKANPNIVEYGRYKLDDLAKNILRSGNTVLILPFSEEDENQIRSPIKLFEYMCIGLPIVASDCAQISNVLKNRHDSLLVKKADVQNWADSMEEILKDHDLRMRLQKNVLESYTPHTWKSRAITLSNFMNTIEKHGH